MSTPSKEATGGFRYEPIPLRSDVRGFVFEPLASGDIPAQRNVHVVLTEPGGIRGNHFHRRGTEISVVLGPGLVRVRLAEGERDFMVPSGEAWRFDFPPGVPHAFQNTGDRAQYLVAFNTEAHDPAQPDVVREVLIES